MSPRPRKVTDDAIFEATLRVMQRVPAQELTLAEVGAEAGVTASAVVQRFGSKQGLLRAVNAKYAEGIAEMLAAIRAAARSPLEALRDYGGYFAMMVDSPATLAHHLGYLQLDLADPEMFTHLRASFRTTRAVLEAWAREAVAAGELRADADPAAVAHVVHTTAHGAMLSAPFFRDGPADAWFRAELDLALEPFRHRDR